MIFLYVVQDEFENLDKIAQKLNWSGLFESKKSSPRPAESEWS